VPNPNITIRNFCIAVQRWGAALGNAHDVAATVDMLERTLADAVYLDVDAHSQHAQLAKYKEAVRVRARPWQRAARERACVCVCLPQLLRG
jgi:hypothetical protein